MDNISEKLKEIDRINALEIKCKKLERVTWIQLWFFIILIVIVVLGIAWEVGTLKAQVQIYTDLVDMYFKG